MDVRQFSLDAVDCVIVQAERLIELRIELVVFLRRPVVDSPQTLSVFAIFQFLEYLSLGIVGLNVPIDAERMPCNGRKMFAGRVRRVAEELPQQGTRTSLKEEHHGQTSRVPNENDNDVERRSSIIVSRTRAVGDR